MTVAKQVELRLDSIGTIANGAQASIAAIPQHCYRVDDWKIESTGFEVVSMPRPGVSARGGQFPWRTVGVCEPIAVVVKNVSGAPKAFRSRLLGLGAF